MNSPSPLIPQGSSLEQQQHARSTLKMKIFCALGVNVVVLLVLLMQGCKREQPQPIEQTPMFSDTNPPPMDLSGDTNLPPVSTVDTSPPPIVPIVEPIQPPPPSTERDYVILKGDTFSSIAPKFGITVKALQAANPTVDPSKLQIGKKIVIPAPVPAAAAPPTGGVGAVAPMVDGGGLYKVKSGDTLSKIATEHHTTVKAIQSANNLTDSRIKVGQQLKLPVKAAPVAPAP
jgi:LysM repeat protein